jgi:hypothetical protein
VRGREPFIGAQAAADFEPAHVGHVNVEQDQRGREQLGQLEGGGAAGGLHDPHPIVFQRDAYQLYHVRLVVGDQDRCHGCRESQATYHSGSRETAGLLR